MWQQQRTTKKITATIKYEKELMEKYKIPKA